MQVTRFVAEIRRKTNEGKDNYPIDQLVTTQLHGATFYTTSICDN